MMESFCSRKRTLELTASPNSKRKAAANVRVVSRKTFGRPSKEGHNHKKWVMVYLRCHDEW